MQNVRQRARHWGECTQKKNKNKNKKTKKTKKTRT